MPKGGYRIIDLGGMNIQSSGTIIHGIYERIESTNGKPIMLTNFSYTEIEQNSVWVSFRSVGSDSYQGIWTGRRDGRFIVISVGQDDQLRVSITPAPSGSSEVNSVNEDGPSASM